MLAIHELGQLIESHVAQRRGRVLIEAEDGLIVLTIAGHAGDLGDGSVAGFHTRNQDDSLLGSGHILHLGAVVASRRSLGSVGVSYLGRDADGSSFKEHHALGAAHAGQCESADVDFGFHAIVTVHIGYGGLRLDHDGNLT